MCLVSRFEFSMYELGQQIGPTLLSASRSMLDVSGVSIRVLDVRVRTTNRSDPIIGESPAIVLGARVVDARCSMLDARCSMLDARCSACLDSGCRCPRDRKSTRLNSSHLVI